MMVERIPLAEFHARLKAQGVSGREHAAVKCPICRTVQSLASFDAAGVSRDLSEKQCGFSCIGRHTDAGPFKKTSEPGRGCDWTLGGLFRLHKLEVEMPDGKVTPAFEIATPEEARALEASWPKPEQVGG